MPANDNLLKYLDSLENGSGNAYNLDEKSSIDNLIKEIKDEPAPKIKPKLKINIKKKKEENKEKIDSENAVSNNVSDIDAFLERAKAKAKEKRSKIANKPVVEREEASTIAGKPKITNYDVNDEDIVDEDIKTHVDDTPSVTDLIKWSETKFPDEWIEIYEKAQRSKKRNLTNEKIKAGRFRINGDHQVEILADKRTDGMSADDMLNGNWMS